MKSATPDSRDVDQPLLLSAAGFSGRARAWSSERSMAHLTILDSNRVPGGAVLDAWVGQLNDHGFRSVRTGAVTERAARQLERHGFHVTQELTLLSLDLAAWQPDDRARSHRLTPRQYDDAAGVDMAAFPAGWSMDARMIADTFEATPFHRARWMSSTDDRSIEAYAISGRSGRHGFIQRLAVHPDVHRRGFGRALLGDGLRWLRRWRVHQVFVNTQVDNEPALRLYEGAGFVALPEGLRVLERAWD